MTERQHIVCQLGRALREVHLTARNWSAEDKQVFAIYTRGDSFLGCVEVASGQLIEWGGRWCKCDSVHLRALQVAWRST